MEYKSEGYTSTYSVLSLYIFLSPTLSQLSFSLTLINIGVDKSIGSRTDRKKNSSSKTNTGFNAGMAKLLTFDRNIITNFIQLVSLQLVDQFS